MKKVIMFCLLAIFFLHGSAFGSFNFIDNGNGTVTDARTGLVWLKLACPGGTKNWYDARTLCASIASGQWGLTDGSTAGQWRLPSKEELEGIGTDPPFTWYDGFPRVTWTKPGTPFTSVQSGYWSAYTSFTGSAWVVHMVNGSVFSSGKSNKCWVWPVREPGEITTTTTTTNMAFATPVPDTGQTKCYNNTVEIPCPQPGGPFNGQDAQYGTNLHSYTDLGNGIVRDNITGLEWQQATAPGTYTWQQAIDYCNNLSLGGKDDWRLPTIKELSTLLDSSIPEYSPTINTSYFPDTVASYYWSSTTYALSIGYAWIVGFGNGNEGGSSNDYYGYVRAVRGGQSSNSFVDNSDGTVTDSSTGLMWQKATAPGTYTWEQALTYCENLTLPAGGYSDWRLPNRNELQSIVDYSTWNQTIDTTFFPNTVASYYWSSTTYVGHIIYAWYVDFYYGYVEGYGKSYGYYVRAVRGGQCGSFGDSDGDGICDDGDVSGVVGDNPCIGGNKVFCDDNCRTTANANQADIDADGIGDVCDTCTDVDDDGYCAQTNDCNDNNPSINPSASEICDGIDNNCNNTIDEGLGQTTCGIGECEHTIDNCANGQVQTCDPMEGAVEEICGDGLDNDCDGEVDEGCATLITLTSFDAIAKSGRVILVWSTESEIDNAGFNLYRSESKDGNYTKITDTLVPAKGSATQGVSYGFENKNVKNGRTYYYKLEDIDLNGMGTMHGPVKAVPRWWK